MSNVAILFANAAYSRQQDLACCLEDLEAMRALIEATERFERIVALSDLDAEAMRDAVRSALVDGEEYDEIFFYFSGHGFQSAEGIFYFCGTGFEAKRPNATGLSQEDLHAMVRAAEPDLFVQIVDACSSGTLLVKSEQPLRAPAKEGLRDLVFLASCKDDQSSFAGDPVSSFTGTLLDAVAERTEGPIYYIDVINALRDEFSDDPVQTPFHVSQGTGREMLIDDAARLEGFREEYRRRWAGEDAESLAEEAEEEVPGTDLVAAAELTLVDRLRAAEERMPSEEAIKSLVDDLFDGVAARFQVGEFAELFEPRTEAHSTFAEPTARSFIIHILSRQQRLDNFVTADVKRRRKKPTPYERLMDSLGTSLLNTFPDYEDFYELELNMKMDRAQMKLVLAPKFMSLQEMVLVLSCAPSLETCYVFEVATRHSRIDLNRFDAEGAELYKRWYTLSWDEGPEWLVERICSGLTQAVGNYVNALDERLSEE